MRANLASSLVFYPLLNSDVYEVIIKLLLFKINKFEIKFEYASFYKKRFGKIKIIWPR